MLTPSGLLSELTEFFLACLLINEYSIEFRLWTSQLTQMPCAS